MAAVMAAFLEMPEDSAFPSGTSSAIDSSSASSLDEDDEYDSPTGLRRSVAVAVEPIDADRATGQVPSSAAAIQQLAVLQAQLENALRPGSSGGLTAGASPRASTSEPWSTEAVGRMRSASLRSNAASDVTEGRGKGRARAESQEDVPDGARPRSTTFSSRRASLPSSGSPVVAPRLGSLPPIPASPDPPDRIGPAMPSTAPDALDEVVLTCTSPTPSIPSSITWPSASLYSRLPFSSSTPNLGLGLLAQAPIESAVRRTEPTVEAVGDRQTAGNGLLEKRYHALRELVETEAAYLEGLHILVTVYFQSLHMLSTLSTTDTASIVRNSACLLELHERLAVRIAKVDAELEWQRPDRLGQPIQDAKVRTAIAKIAAILLDELPNFSHYGEFCAGHGEALNVIRTLETLPDWEAYERHCSTLALYRTISASGGNMTPLARTAGDPFSALATRPTPSVHHKLRFQDYAIQPIQRLCRYPLILGQLLKNLGECSERLVVQTAWDGVRKAAECVDEAQRVREAEMRTKVVAARMEFQSPVHLAFCDILGGTLLIGTLHVLHRSPALEFPRVKYFGCFLYQTHLVMVKVRKRESYEPREWLPLRLFELQDVPEGDGFLPHSLRLSYHDHHFELGATCTTEKAVWLQRLTSTQAEARHQWETQPCDADGLPTFFDDTAISSVYPNMAPSSSSPYISSIPFASHTRSDSVASRTSLSVSPTTLPPLLSYSDEGSPRSPVDTTSATLPTSFSRPVTLSRTNRFSATASSLIGRTPATQRATIDVRLADVFSEECLSARAHAARRADPIPPYGRSRTMSGSKLTAPAPPARRLSVIEQRRVSTISLESGESISPAFRGAVGFHAPSSQLYTDGGQDGNWLTSLKRSKTSAPGSPKARPALPLIDVSLAEATKKRPGTWRSRTMSLRRAASHSSLDGMVRHLPPSPTAAVSVSVERNDSVSSGASSSGTGDTASFTLHQPAETPPSSLPPSPDFERDGDPVPLTSRWSTSGSSTATLAPAVQRRKSQSVLSQPDGATRTKHVSLVGDFFQKRVQSSPALASLFGQAPVSSEWGSYASPPSSHSGGSENSPPTTEPPSPGAGSIISLPSGASSPERRSSISDAPKVRRFMFQYKLSPMT